MNILSLLQGKKTYLAAVATLLVVGLFVFGIINEQVYEALVGALAALGLYALRKAIN